MLAFESAVCAQSRQSTTQRRSPRASRTGAGVATAQGRHVVPVASRKVNVANCARVTGSFGLNVVGDVPVVRFWATIQATGVE